MPTLNRDSGNMFYVMGVSRKDVTKMPRYSLKTPNHATAILEANDKWASGLYESVWVNEELFGTTTWKDGNFLDEYGEPVVDDEQGEIITGEAVEINDEDYDDDPRCVCGVYRSEHALLGCPEGFQTAASWKVERDQIREGIFAEDDGDWYDPGAYEESDAEYDSMPFNTIPGDVAARDSF